MTDRHYETRFGIEVYRLLITQYPREAWLTFAETEIVYELRLRNPRPLETLTEALTDCCRIRIIDRNADGDQQEFGRFTVELWDEDNRYAEFTVDQFEESIKDAEA